MKNINLNKLGVEELNETELQNTNGGYGALLGGLGLGLAVSAVLDYLDDPEGFKDSFWRGFNAI